MTEPEKPAILLIDNQPLQVDRLIQQMDAAGYEVLFCDGLTSTDYILARLEPSRPPLVALIDLDLGLGGDLGLGALTRLVQHPIGKQVTPVLFSNAYDSGTPRPADLHGVLCAHLASRGVPGHGMLAGDKSPDTIRRVLALAPQIRQRRAAGGVRFPVDGPLEGLRFVQPRWFYSTLHSYHVDLIDVLLGTEGLRALWADFEADHDINRSLQDLIRRYPNLTNFLESRRVNRGQGDERNAGKPGNDFLARSDVGALVRAWRAAGSTFDNLPSRVIHPTNDEKPQPSFVAFHIQYSGLLAHPQTHDLAVAYQQMRTAM